MKKFGVTLKSVRFTVLVLITLGFVLTSQVCLAQGNEYSDLLKRLSEYLAEYYNIDPHALYSSPNGQNFNIAGSWISAWGGLSLEETGIWTVTLTPTNASGTKLAYLGYTANPMLWDPLFPTAKVLGLAVGEFVRTGKNTYEFTIYQNGAEAPPEYVGRGRILTVAIYSGTARVIDENTFVTEDATFSFYAAQDVYDPDTGELIIPSQDADHDGFIDEGAVPYLSFYPWDVEFKRVGVGSLY